MEGADHELVELVDEQRAADAAAARTRRRWLHQQLHESSTLAGALADLADARQAVTVRTAGGRTHRGLPVLVGLDVCALFLEGGERLYLPLAAVVWIGTAGDLPAGEGRASAVTLLDVLAEEAGQRAHVQLAARGATALTGVLIAAGVDVVAIRADGSGGTVLVQASSLEEVLVRSSG